MVWICPVANSLPEIADLHAEPTGHGVGRKDLRVEALDVILYQEIDGLGHVIDEEANQIGILGRVRQPAELIEFGLADVGERRNIAGSGRLLDLGFE